MAGVTLLDHFKTLPDPRIERSKRHKVVDIVAITICATVSGCNNFTQVAAYAKAKEAWLKTFLELPHGIPCEHTFRRFFAALDPEAFRTSFVSWVQAVSEAIKGWWPSTGKHPGTATTPAKGSKALHLVSAWAADNGLVLGQVKIQDHSNEITAIPELLKLLALTGCLVTIDAMGCQVDIAQDILDRGADYLLAVKDNQPTFAQNIQGGYEQPARTGSSASSTAT